MRVFIGLTDIANVTENYAKGFRALGHETFTCVWNRSYFYPETQYNVVIDERPAGSNHTLGIKGLFRIVKNLLRAIKGLRCDVFVIYAPAILPTHIIFPLLKLLRKKLICVFWGSDIRYWYALKEEMTQLGVADEMEPFFTFARERAGGSYFDKLRTVHTAEKYADLILSQPGYSQLLSKPYNRATVPIDLSDFQNQPRLSEIPLVLHAPSVPEAKGTDVILQVVEELRSEGLTFEFQKIEKMPTTELRKLLSRADILIDQLYSTTIASIASEAAFSGCAVLARYLPEYSKVPMPCPIINTNIHTIKDDLRKLIQDEPYRRTQALKGPEYVRSVNDHIQVAQRILSALTEGLERKYDFTPTFYRTLIIPEDILAEERRDARRKRVEFFKILFRTGTTGKP